MKESFFSRIGILLSISIMFNFCNYANENDSDNSDDEPSFIVENFFTTIPRTYEPSHKKTYVEISISSNGIEFQFSNYDDGPLLQKRTTLDDEDIITSYNEVIIDFEGNGLRAYRFRVGRTGSRQDAIWINDNDELTDWDSDWQSNTAEYDDHWESAIFIPWTVTPIANTTLQRSIKYYLSRWDSNLSERYANLPISRNDHDFLNRFAELKVIGDIQTNSDTKNLVFYPYLSSTYDTVNKSSETDIGIDVFWQANQNQQINLSINPDFGQVESNELVVNFSAIETFFSEKRPFFKENHELFDLRGPESLRLVHTPRIGSEPALGDQSAADIDYASRYTFYGENIDLGALVAFEADNTFTDEGISLINKGRNYYSTRGLYKSENYKLGLLASFTETPSIQREALVTSIDFETNIAEDIGIKGQFFRTDINQESSSNKSNNWWISAEWQPSDLWSHEMAYFNYQDNLDISDFGFVKRNNRKQFEYEITREWSDFTYLYSVRDLSLLVGTEIRENHQGQDISDQITFELDAVLNNNANLVFESELFSSGVDDILTRGNNPIFLQGGFFNELSYSSDSSKVFNYELAAGIGSGSIDGKLWEITIAPTYQLTDNLSIGLFTVYEREENWLLWDEDEDSDVSKINNIQSYKRKELAFGLNAAYKPTEKHELRIKLESVALNSKFLATYDADTTGVLSVVADQSDDFSVSELAFQLRYKYQYSPRTEIYFVIGRGAERETEDLRLSLGELLKQSFSKPPEQSVLLKIKSAF